MYNSISGTSGQHLPAGNAAVKAIRSARPDRDDSQGGVEGGGALEKERTPFSHANFFERAAINELPDAIQRLIEDDERFCPDDKIQSPRFPTVGAN
jgi:hypothetical protein